MSNKKDIAAKREAEKAMVSLMIKLYCNRKHGTKKELCAECAELESYARSRSDRCPFMENKTFCSNCRVHCYKPEMREKIREVMRFSGTEDDASSSLRSHATCDMHIEGEKKAGKASGTVKFVHKI